MIVSLKFNRKRLCFVVLHFLGVFFELFPKQIKHQFYDNEFNFSHCENVPCVVPHQEIIAQVRNPTFGWRLYLACYEWYEGAQDEAFTPKVKYSSQGRKSRLPQNTQSLLYTHRARRSICRWKLAYLHPLPHAGRSFREDVTHRPVFHIHIPWFAHSLSPGSPCAPPSPWPSLFISQSASHAPEHADSAPLQGCIYQNDKVLADNGRVSQG